MVFRVRGGYRMLGLSQIFSLRYVGKLEVVLASLHCGSRSMGLATFFGWISGGVLAGRVLAICIVV
jgi:hypothetical protein